MDQSLGKKTGALVMQTEETAINASMSLQNQLLATKFFVPIAPRTLVARPRLTTLLQESLKYPLTLVSAPAGFGKTTLLSTWAQSLPANHPALAWISLDEEDNEPHLFWTTIIAALEMHHPGHFTSLLTSLQVSQGLPLKYVLTVLINLLGDNREHFLLVLDDYQMITEQQIHTTISYLFEHLPPQLHIILSTRADPPLSLPQLRARRQMLEVRTDQLRCTAEEAKAFFHQTIGTQLPDGVIQEVTTRTEGWLVGLQLLALSLPARPDPSSLLQEVSGDQRYILDYLTQEVLERQPQEVQTFLLSTCILHRLSGPLCDAIIQQAGSQKMLQQLEQDNLFVVSLDSRRQWYRYHALFAQALCYRLECTHGNLVPILHYRASLWYAQHDQITEAILHAFSAHQWQWAADLIERIWMLEFTWGASEHELVLLRQWLEQLPADIVHSRPRLCLTCARILWQTAPDPMLQGWLNAAETMLTASLTKPSSENTLHTRQEQENLLGEVFAFRAFLQSFQQDGQVTLSLCQQALALLSIDNFVVRAHVISTQILA